MPTILWGVRLELWCKSRESEQVGFQPFANKNMKEMQRFPRFQRRKLLTLSLWMHSETSKDAKLLPEKGKSINVIDRSPLVSLDQNLAASVKRMGIQVKEAS